MIRVAFLIRSLDAGGAERQLTELVKNLDKSQYEILVLTFYPGGLLEKEIIGCWGVRVCSLDKKGRWEIAGFLRRIISILRDFRPDIVHGYLPAANELGLLAGAAMRARVIWGIRSAESAGCYNWTWDALHDIGAFLSRFPDRIICNSSAGRDYYSRIGFSAARMNVIHNGIDIERFRPDPNVGAALRHELGINADELLVGRVGRQDQLKDWPTFFRAFSELRRMRRNARALCVTNMQAGQFSECRELAAMLDLDSHILWLQEGRDMRAVYNALNLCVSSSYSEGFPNVLAEAMSCGVPCAATNAGESALIVARPEFVAPIQDPGALAASMDAALTAFAGAGGNFAREHIVRNFSTVRLAQRTSQIFHEVLDSTIS